MGQATPQATPQVLSSGLTEFDVFDLLPPKVFIDWDYAMRSVENLDPTAEQDGRLPMKGKAAIRVLAEYAAIAHHCSFAPKGTTLAVVVSPPRVWFCPGKAGLHGAFIEEYREDKHGVGVPFYKPDLFDYTNIDARLDAWSFYAGMLTRDRSN
jgi:hypothetical protein